MAGMLHTLLQTVLGCLFKGIDEGRFTAEDYNRWALEQDP